MLSSGANLKVLNPIHISAVTVNPFNSRHGYAEPIKLLEDVGRVVEPVPCFDLFLGIRYEPRGGMGGMQFWMRVRRATWGLRKFGHGLNPYLP